MRALFFLIASHAKHAADTGWHMGAAERSLLAGEPAQQLTPFTMWAYICISILLVLMAGLMSGLTIGLMALDDMEMEARPCFACHTVATLRFDLLAPAATFLRNNVRSSQRAHEIAGACLLILHCIDVNSLAFLPSCGTWRAWTACCHICCSVAHTAQTLLDAKCFFHSRIVCYADAILLADQAGREHRVGSWCRC